MYNFIVSIKCIDSDYNIFTDFKQGGYQFDTHVFTYYVKNNYSYFKTKSNIVRSEIGPDYQTRDNSYFKMSSYHNTSYNSYFKTESITFDLLIGSDAPCSDPHSRYIRLAGGFEDHSRLLLGLDTTSRKKFCTIFVTVTK